MARPAKPVSVIKLESKSHRTKKELRTREQAEESLLSGVALKESKEVKNNPRAHREFLRVHKLLAGIEKSDDLYGSVINRYCLTLAECAEFEEKREHAQELMDKLETRSDEMEFTEFLKLQDNLAKQLISYDKQIQAKNYHFSEYYEKDRICFDYTLKQGRCQTTNAKQLMKLAGFWEDEQ